MKEPVTLKLYNDEMDYWVWEQITTILGVSSDSAGVSLIVTNAIPTDCEGNPLVEDSD